MRNDLRFLKHKIKGSVLLMMLVFLGIFATVLVSALGKANRQIERDKITAAALAKAKEALIGYAATYRDTHAGKVFGYLPCPDNDGDGSAGDCGSKDVTLIGLLPWKTLGLPPLRDSSGECLWYAVSGRFKNSPKTDFLNWDTAGQLIVNDAGGATLASGVAAVIFSPRGVIGSQNRTPVGTTECGGNTTVAAYLDGSDPLYAGTVPAAGASSTLIVATVASITNGTNNDQGLWITPTEIFDRIKRRSDFATDITNLLNDVKDQAAKNAACAIGVTFNPPTAGITDPGGLGKSVGLAPNIYQTCIPTNAPLRKEVFNNWRNNVLYAVCPSSSTACLTVNGDSNCAAAVIFSGERASGKSRPSVNATDYLEGVNLSAFTTISTVLSGAAPYIYTASASDIALCIPPL